MAEGIWRDNSQITRTESFLTLDQFKERYLFGVDLSDDEGNPISDETLENYINIAISTLEHDLDISIAPREFSGDETEEKDYHANDYWNWSFFQLNNIPVIEVKEVRAVYPNASILTYPKEWHKIQKHDGILRLIPTAGTLSQFTVDSGGQYFPEIFRNQGFVPLVWQIDYVAGFEDGKVPKAINHAIGLIAGILVLNQLGDLVIGAGVAGQSISLDGLSQSVQTTASAEFHAYSARVKEYYKQLFGDTQGGRNTGLIQTLRDYWRGQEIYVL